MKLELKHLAPYLPHKLKTVNFNVGKLLDKPLISELIASNIMCFVDGSTEQKILLRPLSDLTKEIEVNGEKFVPIEKVENWNTSIDFGKELVSLIEDERWLSTTSYVLVELLFEWHFDVFGLIENNLAIDINTLNQ